MNRQFWLLRGLRFVFFAALFIAALGFGTMYLWNWLMPELFHLPAITLGQTYGLLLLGRLLFGFKPGGGGSKAEWMRRYKMKQHMAERMGNLSTEEKEKFRQQMRARCAPWGRPQAADTTPAEATA